MRTTTKKKAPDSNKSPASAILMAVYGALLTAAIAVIALVSPQLAFMAAGFAGLYGYVFMDKSRRKKWEAAFNTQFQSLKFNFKKLERETTQNASVLSEMQEDMATMIAEIDKHAASLKDMTSGGRSTGLATEKPAVTYGQIAKKSLTPAESFVMPETPLRALRPAQAAEEPEFGPAVIRQLVLHAVKSRSIEMFVQPIMRMPQRKTRFYELYARLRARPGIYIPANQYMSHARQEKVENEIDALLLTQCLKVIRASAHIEKATPFFINITEATLKNAAYMQKLLKFISQNRELAERLVFEIPQSQYDNLSPAALEIVKGLGKLKCSFALGNTKTLDCDIEELMRFKVRYVKMHANDLIEKIRTVTGLNETMKLKRRMEGNGIALIAERIETENDLRALMDLDINFAQGYLFGMPDLQAAYTRKKAA